MFDKVTNVLQERHQLFYQHEGVTLCTVPNAKAGIELSSSLLSNLADRKTAVYLSGGRTPKDLYTHLTKEESFVAGAVGMVDERFGEKMHAASNEKMIAETELLKYLGFRNVPFYPMLTTKKEQTLEEAAEEYDQQLRSMHAVFQRHVGILGIGADGHTAGIAGERHDFHNPLFDVEQKNLLVSHFNDTTGTFHERITMTFLALSMLDVLMVLMFGEDKKEALQKVFQEGSEEEIPARFYKRPDIAKKTLFITDQSV